MVLCSIFPRRVLAANVSESPLELELKLKIKRTISYQTLNDGLLVFASICNFRILQNSFSQ